MSALAALSKFSRVVDRLVKQITFACAWFSLLSLIAATALDVAIRQIAHVGSDKLSEIEAALFLALVMTSLGYTYLADEHVRIDIFREKLSAKTRALVEMLGCIAILMPISGILISFGTGSVLTAYLEGLKLEAFEDLPLQWVIKSTVPIGFLLLFLAGVCVVIRNVLFLVGKEAAPAPRGYTAPQQIHNDSKGASDGG
jgi:TRAP-type mannitol/chloroaromatic compound transport system permease small subunit